MRSINVPRLALPGDYPPLEDISARLDDLQEMHMIDVVNWEQFSYKPQAGFKIAYSTREIYIKYYVSEKYVKAEKTGINQAVYEDSCVEFFAAPGDDDIYYNFEFNSIGALLAEHGSGRHNRTPVHPSVSGRIRTLPGLGREPFPERMGHQNWTLTLALPVDVFFRHKIDETAGRQFGANFYKCGDKLSRPHYLTWNPVLSQEPDFHRPGDFGIISFI